MESTTDDESNSERSARWIKFFNAELVEKFPYQDGYCVFSRGNPKELLYDITVIQQFTEESPIRKVELRLPGKCLWQIESEFDERDSRSLADDLGKLVLGAAVCKLFVTSNEWFSNCHKYQWITNVTSQVARVIHRKFSSDRPVCTCSQ